MRVVDTNHKTITEYDLTKGRLEPFFSVREDAVPIDNVTKFAWADDDWEEVLMYIPSSEHKDEPGGQDSAVWDELDAAYQEGVDSV